MKPGQSSKEEDDEWVNLLEAIQPAGQPREKKEEHSTLLNEVPKRPYYYELDMKYNIDTFFYCTSPPAQMTHYYRYGTLKDCHAAMMDVWFCLSHRLADPEKQAAAVQARRDTYPKKTSTDSIWRLKPEKTRPS